MTDFSDMARGIIESNRYLVLGTADEAGVPWVTPVWYAQSDYRRFIWVSSPDRRHSRNLRARPEVSIVIFDSHVAVGSARAVYMSARAEEMATPQVLAIRKSSVRVSVAALPTRSPSPRRCVHFSRTAEAPRQRRPSK